jgi:hypothetical protein
MIGRILSVTANGPVRNVSVSISGDMIASSISNPPGPVKVREVTSVSIRGSRVGRCLSASIVLIWGVGLLMLYLFSFGSPWVVIASTTFVAYLIRRYHRLELCSLTLHTESPQRPRVVFYRTFERFDLAQMLDWLESVIGSFPRQVHGSLRDILTEPIH